MDWLARYQDNVSGWNIGTWSPGLNSAAPMGDQTNIDNIISGTELTSPCPILLMASIRLGSDNYQFCMSMV